jgi:hypothetical protein
LEEGDDLSDLGVGQPSREHQLLPQLLKGHPPGRRQGDLAQARALFAQSLPLWRAIDDPVELAVWLEQFAALELASGRPEEAARVLGVVSAARQKAGHALSGSDAAWEDEATRNARDALGEEAFLAAWAAGRSWPLKEALDWAEAALAEPTESDSPHHSKQHPGINCPRVPRTEPQRSEQSQQMT